MTLRFYLFRAQENLSSLLAFVISAFGSRFQFLMVGEPHTQRMPRTFARAICRPVPNAVNRAEVANNLLVNSVKILQFSRLINYIPTLFGQDDELLAGRRIS